MIGGKFLAVKTPLDERYDSQVAPENLFYPSMVFSSMRSHKVKVGLWIDLTNTSRCVLSTIILSATPSVQATQLRRKNVNFASGSTTSG